MDKGTYQDRGRLEMSQRERDVLKVLEPVRLKKRTQREAARLLGVTDRTIRRMLERLEVHGDVGVIHGLRGRPSNHAIASEHRRAVLEGYRMRHLGDGPTFAAEALTAAALNVKAQTLRLWLLAEGCWGRRRRRDKHRCRRRRRDCFGELVQADGSHHDWLQGRGPQMVLLVMIDDATSKVVARFYPAETTEGYMDLLGRYVRKYGRMVALYTDHDSVFYVQDGEGRPVLTQFGRALEELGIGWIGANSPQAKGRVERFNGTAQDRLVKQLRLANACTMEQANAVLDAVFLPWFNRHCVVAPASGNDAHRPLHQSMNLAAILSIQEQRRVCNDYTIQLDNRVYQILPPAYPGLRGGLVTVEKRLDGTMHLRFRKQYLKYQVAPMTQRSGDLPPTPRSLSLSRTPAEPPDVKQGCPVEAGQPCAVRPAQGRSGRTPAEPYPAQSLQETTIQQPWRPPVDHPWRRFRLKGSPHKQDIPICTK